MTNTINSTDHLESAADINLTSSDLKNIEELLVRFPNVGERYPEGSMKDLIDKN